MKRALAATVAAATLVLALDVLPAAAQYDGALGNYEFHTAPNLNPVPSYAEPAGPSMAQPMPAAPPPVVVAPAPMSGPTAGTNPGLIGQGRVGNTVVGGQIQDQGRSVSVHGNVTINPPTGATIDHSQPQMKPGQANRGQTQQP